MKKDNNVNEKQGAKCSEVREATSLVASLQSLLKKNGRLYYFLLWLFSPVLLSYANNKAVKRLLKKYGTKDIILNIGSGPTCFHNRKDIINVDICKYNEVDIVSDITELSIDNGKVDFIINIAALEHVDKADAAIGEMYRILKPGGEVLCYVPFIIPFHAAPQDFHRWTILGLENLFSEFEVLEAGVGAGPTCGLLWVFQEWIAILLSFGSKIIHDIIFLTMLVITMPVKFIDILLSQFPHAENIASGFYIVAKKKQAG